MSSIKTVFLTALIFSLLLPAAAWAAPKINLSMTAEKEVVVQENGQQVTKRVAATEVEPGEILSYTISYENVGDETATNVVLNNPIPEGSVYLAEEVTENMDFSIDGGNTYKKPALLTYEVALPDGAKESRVASPDKYTHIRWTISEIPAGDKGSVSFKVEIK